MKCDVCGRELSPGEGFVRLEAYVVMSREVFRTTEGEPRKVACMVCLCTTQGVFKALLEGSPAPERSGQ